jgi:hypothetical protein
MSLPSPLLYSRTLSEMSAGSSHSVVKDELQEGVRGAFPSPGEDPRIGNFLVQVIPHGVGSVTGFIEVYLAGVYVWEIDAAANYLSGVFEYGFELLYPWDLVFFKSGGSGGFGLSVYDVTLYPGMGWTEERPLVSRGIPRCPFSLTPLPRSGSSVQDSRIFPTIEASSPQQQVLAGRFRVRT